MPFNGSGVFNRIYSWVADKNAGIDITASRMDTDTDDITTNGLGLCMTRDGQGSASTDIPWNGNKITGLGAATAAGDALSWGNPIGPEGTFTPTDVSGGSLTLGSPVGFYRKIGNVVHVWASWTHPSTSDSNAVKIGGLPFTSANLAMQIGGFPGIVEFNAGAGDPAGSNFVVPVVLKNTENFIITHDGGLSMTNANLSTYNVNVYFTYPV